MEFHKPCRRKHIAFPTSIPLRRTHIYKLEPIFTLSSTSWNAPILDKMCSGKKNRWGFPKNLGEQFGPPTIIVIKSSKSSKGSKNEEGGGKSGQRQRRKETVPHSTASISATTSSDEEGPSDSKHHRWKKQHDGDGRNEHCRAISTRVRHRDEGTRIEESNDRSRHSDHRTYHDGRRFENDSTENLNLAISLRNSKDKTSRNSNSREEKPRHRDKKHVTVLVPGARLFSSHKDEPSTISSQIYPKCPLPFWSRSQ